MDWNLTWVIEFLLRENLTPINEEEAFEESIRQCLPETTTIGWLHYDTVSAIKELDPISFKLAAGEWLDSEVSDEQILTFDNGSTHYYAHDVETFLDGSEASEESA